MPVCFNRAKSLGSGPQIGADPRYNEAGARSREAQGDRNAKSRSLVIRAYKREFPRDDNFFILQKRKMGSGLPPEAYR